MKKLFCWMKSHPNLIILISISLFLIPLLVVHLLFKWKSNIYFIEAEWGAGDLIAYIACFYSLIGSIALSLLALWQNFKFKEENDRKDALLLHIENEKIRLNNQPQFLIESTDPRKCIDNNYAINEELRDYVLLKQFTTYIVTISNEKIEWIPFDLHPVIPKAHITRVFSIINCGNNTAHQVKLSIAIGSKHWDCEKASSIQKDGEIHFYLDIKKDWNSTDDIILTIRFFDCFQNIYTQKFQIVNEKDIVYLKSYTDISLDIRNKSINFLN